MTAQMPTCKHCGTRSRQLPLILMLGHMKAWSTTAPQRCTQMWAQTVPAVGMIPRQFNPCEHWPPESS
jgi:hypothetical protein